jgi:hypothetical protein
VKNPDVQRSYPSLEESKRILASSSPKDFDGHTSFAWMNTEQRIQWASLTALSVFHAKKERSSSIPVSENHEESA